jgi:tight adherence protein B
VSSVSEALALAARSGLPPGDLIRDCARDLRRARSVRVGRRLARLSVVLVLPMGLCLLPAAVLLGVAPVVLGLLGQIGE